MRKRLGNLIVSVIVGGFLLFVLGMVIQTTWEGGKGIAGLGAVLFVLGLILAVIFTWFRHIIKALTGDG